MKLVFLAGVGGSDVHIKLLDTPTFPLKWCALHWVPTEEDRKRRFLGLLKYYHPPKWIPDLYSDFATLCMGDAGIAYAVLNSIWGLGGFDDLRKNLDAVGLHSYEVNEKTLIAELGREHMPMVFKEGSWQVNRFYLFLSRQNIPDWPQKLRETLEAHGFSYGLLESLEAIVSNYWEHGIEAISTNLTIDSLRDVATRISDKLGVPLEVKESGPQRTRKRTLFEFTSASRLTEGCSLDPGTRNQRTFIKRKQIQPERSYWPSFS